MIPACLTGGSQRYSCCWHLFIRVGIEPTTLGFLVPYSTKLNYRMFVSRHGLCHMAGNLEHNKLPPVILDVESYIFLVAVHVFVAKTRHLPFGVRVRT